MEGGKIHEKTEAGAEDGGKGTKRVVKERGQSPKALKERRGECFEGGIRKQKPSSVSVLPLLLRQ